ncbi:MAG: hypothetical protein ABIG55_00400 [Candidatus Omnitrophota bacterium]|nr:hypothetical protein [Candidatus Omnitrophota bacterium]
MKIKLTVLFLAAVCVPAYAFPAERAASVKRDPFVPLVGVSADVQVEGGAILSVSDVSLQGIIKGADGSYTAIINGEMMKEGYGTQNFRIKKISDNSVVMGIGEEDHEIQLYE